jgi:hypothetical protein
MFFMFSASIIHKLFALHDFLDLGISSLSIVHLFSFGLYSLANRTLALCGTLDLDPFVLCFLQFCNFCIDMINFTAMWQHWFPTRTMLSQPPMIT